METQWKFVLASRSPRRQELLRLLGIQDFTIRIPAEDSHCPEGLSPTETVEWIAQQKRVPCTEEEIVIAADTMVFLDDRRLGKPHDEADALRMLTALQGKRHVVCTGVTVRWGERCLTRSQATDVFFRPVSQEELRAYIATGEPMDKAGAYGIQGRGALLVERLEGDYFNVMGLPVLLLSRMLTELGVPVGLGGVGGRL